MPVLAVAVDAGGRCAEQGHSGQGGCVGTIKTAISDLLPVAAGCVIHLAIP